MHPALAFALGLGAGYALTVLLVRPGNCCDRVLAAVREEVVGAVGPAGGYVFDGLGLGKIAPGLLNFFGVS